MIETQYRLDKSITVTIPASGGIFSSPIGPVGYLERWHIERLAIQTTGTNRTGKFFVYRGPTSSLYQVDYTEKMAGDTSETNLDLLAGETITFEWRSCTVGVIGTVHVIGSYYVPAR